MPTENITNSESTELQKKQQKQLRRPPSKLKAYIFVILFTLIVFGGIFGYKAFQDHMIAKFMAHYQPPPQAVSTVTAKIQDWHPYIQTSGQAEAIQSVNVTAQVSGIITKIYFQSGQAVKKGQKLFEMDTMALQAQLAQNTANMKLAQITHRRDKSLYEKNAISQQAYDQTLAQYDASKAEVAATQANINYRIIRAPFSGRIGIRQINVGQFFQAGNTAAPLNTINPIYVNFTIPGNQVSDVVLGETVKVYPDSDEQHAMTGTVTSINSEVTNDTRGLTVQATIDNPDKRIIAGMYINTHLILPIQNNVVTIPQTAINHTLYGNTVFVLTSPKKQGKQTVYNAKEVNVKIGTLNGKQAQITEGVQAGDLIVNTGQFKLKNNTPVIINNDNSLKL